MEIYTIGFTQKSAAEFFGLLKGAGIQRLMDVRLNNRSQLAGFTKAGDLEFFLGEICAAEYLHLPELSPTREILNAYKKKQMPWEVYEPAFLGLLAQRKIEEKLDRRLFELPCVLLCSEPTAEHCHRRLVAEYLAGKWPDVVIVHL